MRVGEKCRVRTIKFEWVTNSYINMENVGQRNGITNLRSIDDIIDSVIADHPPTKLYQSFVMGWRQSKFSNNVLVRLEVGLGGF